MTMPSDAPRTLFGIAEVQASTGLGRTQIYELIGSGELPSVKIGRRRMVRAGDLNKWVASLPAEPFSDNGTEESVREI